LPNGKVLVAGGYGLTGITNSAELYDPVSGTWTVAASLPLKIYDHTATLLPSGMVLVCGGLSGLGTATNSAELFDPTSGPGGTWTTVGSMNTPRRWHTASLLPNGKVLVAGGQDNTMTVLSSAELYDPVTATWSLTGSLGTARVSHMASLLPNGKVLVAGGQDTNGTSLPTSELYDVGLGFSAAWQPQIATVTSPLNLGTSLVLAGSKFRGLTEASGGNSTQNSSSDHPVVQLHSIENDQVIFLSSTNWSTNSFVSLPVTNFPPGWALATVFANGIPGASAILRFAPSPTTIVLSNPVRLPGGAVQVGFTNAPGSVFTALATTNLSAALSSWTTLGGVTEVSDGQFQFTDSQATNYPQRFYRVHSP